MLWYNNQLKKPTVLFKVLSSYNCVQMHQTARAFKYSLCLCCIIPTLFTSNTRKPACDTNMENNVHKSSEENKTHWQYKDVSGWRDQNINLNWIKLNQGRPDTYCTFIYKAIILPFNRKHNKRTPSKRTLKFSQHYVILVARYFLPVS